MQIPHSIAMHHAKRPKQPPPIECGHAFAWHHIRGRVPSDWEITAYSVEDRVGRIEFNTRHGLEAVVSWEPCKREPDRLTTMATFLSNHILGKKNAGTLRATDLKTTEMGLFLVGWMDETLPCQAMGYDPASEHLIRWVFEGRTARTGRDTVIRPILTACDFNADPEACEYNLHGIRARLPWEYKIEDIVVLPANVMMSFESEASMRKAVFRRWGLAAMIRGEQTLVDFYTPILRSHNILVDAAEPCRIGGCEAFRLTFNAPREHHSDRFMRRRWQDGTAWIWHDRQANRLNTFEQIGPRQSAALAFETVFPGLSVEASVG